MNDWGIFPNSLLSKTSQLISRYIQLGLSLGTAESCTGGLLGSLITSIPNSSKVYCGGVVCYSNQLKIDYLMIMPAVLNQYGAVSMQVAQQMAEGLLKNSTFDISISITGIAGPGGSTTNKSVGLVYISCKNKCTQNCITRSFQFTPYSRDYIRLATLQEAIKILHEIVV